MSNRLNKERETELQPKRMEYAIEQLEAAGMDVEKVNEIVLSFEFKGEIVMFYPYSGWATGKSIKDGRGIENLLKQVRPPNEPNDG